MLDVQALHPRGGARPRFDVGEIFSRFAEPFRREHAVTSEQARVMAAIMRCRTAALGGHAYACSDCGLVVPAYNSCRDRHCPKCQGAAQYRWIEARKARLLNTPYFHVVLTLPAELRPLAQRNPRLVYELLMKSAAQALLTLGLDPRRLGGLLGVTAVLHTWSRTLAYHPHVHCIVTGGGLTTGGEWIASKRHLLLPVRPLGALFRGKFLDGLRKAAATGALELPGDAASFSGLIDQMYRTRWHVYAKRAFSGPMHVFSYLGRYTHRVGLANSRIRAVTEHGITFTTHGEDTVTLAPGEFMRRFLQHVLPKRFVKIRHYGLSASVHANTKHVEAAGLLGPMPDLEVEHDAVPVDPDIFVEVGVFVVLLAQQDATPCPRCRTGLLRITHQGPDPP